MENKKLNTACSLRKLSLLVIFSHQVSSADKNTPTKLNLVLTSFHCFKGNGVKKQILIVEYISTGPKMQL